MKTRRGFWIHLTAFLLVNALLLAINLIATSGHLWFQWPLLGWGTGLIAHAVVAFVLPGTRGKMIDKEMGRQGS